MYIWWQMAISHYSFYFISVIPKTLFRSFLTVPQSNFVLMIFFQSKERHFSKSPVFIEGEITYSSICAYRIPVEMCMKNMHPIGVKLFSRKKDVSCGSRMKSDAYSETLCQGFPPVNWKKVEQKNVVTSFIWNFVVWDR